MIIFNWPPRVLPSATAGFDASAGAKVISWGGSGSDAGGVTTCSGTSAIDSIADDGAISSGAAGTGVTAGGAITGAMAGAITGSTAATGTAIVVGTSIISGALFFGVATSTVPLLAIGARATGVPHFLQNFAPASSAVPQDTQASAATGALTAVAGVPHFLQNLVPTGLSVPQWVQLVIVFPGLVPSPEHVFTMKHAHAMNLKRERISISQACCL
jgi:hypothetical protein